MSTSTLANIVRQLRAQGESEVVVDCDGQPVHIELRTALKACPIAKPLRRTFAQCAAALLRAATEQKISHN